jgi:hypothetical protein
MLTGGWPLRKAERATVSDELLSLAGGERVLTAELLSFTDQEPTLTVGERTLTVGERALKSGCTSLRRRLRLRTRSQERTHSDERR